MVRRYRIGIDTGGTFTDFTVLGPDRGFIVKVPSTPDDPSRAVLQGLEQILDRIADRTGTRRGAATTAERPGEARPFQSRMEGLGTGARRRLLASCDLVHGTTVGTNALITRRVARTAFITTAGFEDLVEIGRQNRESLYDLAADRPHPLVPRGLRFGVRERVYTGVPGGDPSPAQRKGSREGGRQAPGGGLPPRRGRLSMVERTPPTRAALARLRRDLRKLDVESIAIGFLHSYLDPAHEEAAADALRTLGVPVTLSYRISGEYREYERFSTAIANAALQPIVSRYLRDLSAGVAPAPLAILQSDGTTGTAASAAEEPVRTVLSGPAGGALAAFDLARHLRDAHVLSFDMGGTSTDAVLIDRDLPRVPMGRIGGLPLRAPTIDVRTVGAGGGSIARRDPAGALRVGPDSAGADPGPACYGKGETPTVTDAHLVLGRLGERDLLGGEFEVDASRSRSAIGRLARSLGLSLDRTAEGILTVVEATMERALRAISLEQGRDPRTHALYAFGGAGGLHACALAQRLGITRIVIPPGPGVFSATGLAGAVAGVEVAATLLASSTEAGALRACFARLEQRARARLREQGHGSRPLDLVHRADLRYAGQSHEITVPYGPSMVATFHSVHRERFGHAREGCEVEVVTLRVRAHALEPRGAVRFAPARSVSSESRDPGADPSGPPKKDGSSRPSLLTSRRVSRGGAAIAPPAERVGVRDLGGDRARAASPRSSANVIYLGKRLSCPVLRRELIQKDGAVRGPARITEYSATTFVAPGWTGRPGPHGTLVLTTRWERQQRA